MNIKYEVFNDDIFNKYELLRLDAYGKDIFCNCKNYYLKLVTNKMLIVGLYIDEELIAGCYVSGYRDYLFIDQLFVKSSYQNCGLKIGRTLLLDVMNNREFIEDFFDKKYSSVKLFSYDEKSKSIYKSLGFNSVGKSIFMSKML